MGEVPTEVASSAPEDFPRVLLPDCGPECEVGELRAGRRTPGSVLRRKS